MGEPTQGPIRGSLLNYERQFRAVLWSNFSMKYICISLYETFLKAEKKGLNAILYFLYILDRVFLDSPCWLETHPGVILVWDF